MMKTLFCRALEATIPVCKITSVVFLLIRFIFLRCLGTDYLKKRRAIMLQQHFACG